jgi:hypothetical protein
MLPVILVFGGDEGLLQPDRYCFDRHKEAVLVGEFGDQRAIAGMDARCHGRFVLAQRSMVWQALEGGQYENAEAD